MGAHHEQQADDNADADRYNRGVQKVLPLDRLAEEPPEQRGQYRVTYGVHGDELQEFLLVVGEFHCILVLRRFWSAFSKIVIP